MSTIRKLCIIPLVCMRFIQILPLLQQMRVEVLLLQYWFVNINAVRCNIVLFFLHTRVLPSSKWSRNNQGLSYTTYLVQTINYTSLRMYYDPQNGISLVLLYESVKLMYEPFKFFFVATSGACVFLFFFFYKSDLHRETITVRR
jgi:hypothetical protein